MLSPKAKTGKSPRPYLRNANVQWGHIDLTDLSEMDFDDGEYDRYGLLPGDVLICEGGEVGRTAIWRGELRECYYQKAIHRLRPRGKQMLAEFLAYHMIHAFLIQKSYGEVGTVTTIAHLPGVKLKTLPVPVPPLDEQQDIVATLQMLQRAKEATEKVIAATRQLKASLMKHLFTYGPVPLDKADRVHLKESAVGPIPESWPVVDLGSVSELFQYGTSRRCDAQSPGQPVLRIPNIIGGTVDVSELKYLAPDRDEAERYHLVPGDLLFVRTNGQRRYVGRCAVYQGEPKEALFASYLIRVRVKADVILPEFVHLYSETESGRGYLSGRASGAADGKFNINTQTLRSVQLACPTLDVQRQILEMVDAISTSEREESLRLTSLRALFSSALHHLMTGKLRVKDIEAQHEA